MLQHNNTCKKNSLNFNVENQDLLLRKTKAFSLEDATKMLIVYEQLNDQRRKNLSFTMWDLLMSEQPLVLE